jgi:alpha-beta hydrolase superfamily lysophospholipase
MKGSVCGTVKQILRALLHGAAGGLLVGIIGLIFVLERRPPLEVWHKVDLDEEFTQRSKVDSFAEYRALEERLFQQLVSEVYDQIGTDEKREINRYDRGSLSDPSRWPHNWNQSFEFPTPDPVAGVLLLHGMSDSPYSMRSLGERLRDENAWVVGMRVPGHGTAPSGLVHVEWQDMAAAVRIAAKHVHENAKGAPFVIVGYSNGGALAVHYVLEALGEAELPLPAAIILLSPEIGITKLAAFAAWQERLGHLLGLEKLAWNSILPEYDPWKYGSFALNAGKQAYLITQEIQRLITKHGQEGDSLERFPPMLAFQSVVDATVTAPTLVSGLFERLPANGHELVIFDINRYTEIEPIMKHDPAAWLESTLKNSKTPFSVEVVGNTNDKTEKVSIRRREAGQAGVDLQKSTGLAWPPHVYSLSHVALPFPPEDPVYGGAQAGESPGIQLGKLALRGEKGVLQISGTDMLRLRWNPFYPYIEDRVVAMVRRFEAEPD